MKYTFAIFYIFLLAPTLIFSQTYTVEYSQKHVDGFYDSLIIWNDESSHLKENREVLEPILTTLDATYILQFNQSQSDFRFKENNAKDIKDVQTVKGGGDKDIIQSSGDMLIAFLHNNKKHYIKDELPKYNWKIHSIETRMILGVLCIKATTKHNEQNITAWFAPSISKQLGPDRYFGLPGLILELSNSVHTYTAISFTKEKSKENNIEIIQSAKKSVTLQEFYKICESNDSKFSF